jgi:hypothetical protein
VMIDAFESSFAGGACNDAVRAHDGTAKPGLSMLSTISRTRLTSNWLRGFLRDSRTLLPVVLSSFLAFTAIGAFIGFPSKGFEFCFARNAERCTKKQNALRGGGGRLSVRAVKAALLAVCGPKSR